MQKSLVQTLGGNIQPVFSPLNTCVFFQREPLLPIEPPNWRQAVYDLKAWSQQRHDIIVKVVVTEEGQYHSIQPHLLIIPNDGSWLLKLVRYLTFIIFSKFSSAVLLIPKFVYIARLKSFK